MVFECVVEEGHDHNQGVWKADGNQNGHDDHRTSNHFHVSLNVNESIGAADMATHLSHVSHEFEIDKYDQRDWKCIAGNCAINDEERKLKRDLTDLIVRIVEYSVGEQAGHQIDVTIDPCQDYGESLPAC